MITLFGHGFIGREFVKQFPNTHVAPRETKYCGTEQALYTRSTIHNYHPKEGDFYIDIETNLIALMSFLEANHNRDVTVNFISSWFVYGNTVLPAKEDAVCNPTGFYSITKRTAEQLLISYCKTFGVNYKIIRLPNVLGVDDDKVSAKKNALQWMIKEMAEGRTISLYKGGVLRDYMDVRDVTRAIHLIIEKGENNQIYNVCADEAYAVEHLIGVAVRELEYKEKIEEIEVPDFHKIVQVRDMYMDSTKLRNLGFIRRHDVRETVKEIARHYKNG